MHANVETWQSWPQYGIKVVEKDVRLKENRNYSRFTRDLDFPQSILPIFFINLHHSFYHFHDI